VVGIIGLYIHWFKKKNVDHTTECSFLNYMNGSFAATLYSIGGILFAEINLSLLQESEYMGLKDMIAAFTLGYSIDSGVNKAPDKDS
jgi:hypothetical protein